MQAHAITRQQQWLLLAFGIALLFFRWPDLWISPRFWAEEGQVYFAYAWHHDFWDTLFKPHLGYYSLLNNLAVIAATRVPLEWAPLVTTALSFLVQVVPIAIVCFGNSRYWETITRKCVIVLAMLLTMSIELWLNIINAHFHLALIVFLIMLEDHSRHDAVVRWCYRGLVFVAGFTGAIACFLAPILLLKAWFTRQREDWILALLLGTIAVIQAGIVVGIYFSAANELTDYRLVSSAPTTPTDLVRRLLRYHFFTPFAEPIHERFSLGYYLIGLSLVSYFFYFAWRLDKTLQDKLILLAIGWVSVLSLLFSVHMAGGPRYAYAVVVMIVVFLVNACTRVPLGRRAAGWLKTVALASFLINALNFYVPFYYPPASDWPQWRDELARWRADPSYQPQVWPAFPGGQEWRVSLTTPPEQYTNLPDELLKQQQSKP